MVSLYEDLMLGGDWGDLFASRSVDGGFDALKGSKEDAGVIDDAMLPDLLATEDLQTDYLGQSEWMTTWTDLLNVPADPLDPVEEILQQAERQLLVEPETLNTCQPADDSFIEGLLNEATAATPVDEIPALISFDRVVANEFTPLSPPLSTDDIESILSDPSSPMSDTSCSDRSTIMLDESVSFLDDPDWTPAAEVSPARTVKSYTKLRPKPYDKPVASQSTRPSTTQLSKKERKREQNKNAAIRYREKKRAEAEVVHSEERVLEDKNTALKKRVDSMTNEIQYLKDLLKEVYKAKGLKIDKKLLS